MGRWRSRQLVGFDHTEALSWIRRVPAERRVVCVSLR